MALPPGLKGQPEKVRMETWPFRCNRALVLAEGRWERLQQEKIRGLVLGMG